MFLLMINLFFTTLAICAPTYKKNKHKQHIIYELKQIRASLTDPHTEFRLVSTIVVL